MPYSPFSIGLSPAARRELTVLSYVQRPIRRHDSLCRVHLFRRRPASPAQGRQVVYQISAAFSYVPPLLSEQPIHFQSTLFT